MSNFGKVLLLVLSILYIVSPLDACPGPIDDMIILVFGIMANKCQTYIEE